MELIHVKKTSDEFPLNLETYLAFEAPARKTTEVFEVLEKGFPLWPSIRHVKRVRKSATKPDVVEILLSKDEGDNLELSDPLREIVGEDLVILKVEVPIYPPPDPEKAKLWNLSYWPTVPHVRPQKNSFSKTEKELLSKIVTTEFCDSSSESQLPSDPCSSKCVFIINDSLLAYRNPKGSLLKSSMDHAVLAAIDVAAKHTKQKKTTDLETIVAAAKLDANLADPTEDDPSETPDRYLLAESTCVVTEKMCVMCEMALVLSRVAKLVIPEQAAKVVDEGPGNSGCEVKPACYRFSASNAFPNVDLRANSKLNHRVELFVARLG